jgi:alkylated DNA repair dioxygenase AlkB
VSTSSLNLFSHDPSANLLPADGIVNYYGPVLSPEAAWHYHDTLLNGIPWKHDETIIFGKHIITARKVAWYGDREYAYTYSGTTKQALPWTKELRELKALVEKHSRDTYNSCLLNLYHTGDESMGWHSDDEKMIGKDTAIASLSLGAERKFAFKHKRSGETVSVLLHHGSLLVMKGTCQTHWLHRLPPTKKVTTPRINLTFRTIVLS